MKWQILIPTIPHRHAKLGELLDVLAAQMQPGVEVLIYHDNLQASYAQKLQALADAATADYTSHLADDDSVSPGFIGGVLHALESQPDYVGFTVRYTENGVVQAPVVHSLRCGGWHDSPGLYLRDLMYYNPIRRELAEQVKFRGAFCDTEWGDDLRALGIVKTEVFINEDLLYYRRVSTDNFHTPRQPMTDIPAPFIYPFARYI